MYNVGFLSLEEIDESQYNLTIPDSGKEVEVNLKKRKRVVEDKVDGNIKIDEEKKKKKKNKAKNVPTQGEWNLAFIYVKFLCILSRSIKVM